MKINIIESDISHNIELIPETIEEHSIFWSLKSNYKSVTCRLTNDNKLVVSLIK